MKLSELCVTPLQRIQTLGGDVLHAMKKSDSGFAGFGEAYFSWVAIGAVKGWKRHTRMTMNLVVPVGTVRFVFRGNDEEGKPAFHVEEIGDSRYVRITVPPNIWFGFMGLSAPQSLVLNIASILHDPDEGERLALDSIEYDWN